MEYVKFSNREWKAVRTAAKAEWEANQLGKRPDYKTVAADLPNRFVITFLEWLAMLVLVVLTVFTSYKVGALAVPFAEKLVEALSDHTTITPIIGDSFKLVTVILFALLATPSLIYFKLLDKDPEVEAQKKATRNKPWSYRLTLDYLTPRLPYLIVYISAAWLVYVSTFGQGSIFERFLPVIAEIALAQLVGTIIQKRTDYRNVVLAALEDKRAVWDARKRGFETDAEFLKILYQHMRDAILKIQRGGKTPNAGLELADGKDMDTILLNEYRRLTGGLHFAGAVMKYSDTIETAAPAPTQQPVQTGKRVPPYGERNWTPDSLTLDLRKRGVPPTYTERELAEEYAPGYNARGAWRGGAKQAITGAK